MIPASCCRYFLIFIWTTTVIPSYEVSARGSTVEGIALDSSYFFYQQSELPKDCQDVLHECSAGNVSGVYDIKPDGYPEPFGVYCEITEDSGRWTVIQRRTSNGTINFNRDWDDFKNGFGFLSREFWIGNERLAYLTNQKNYQLLIEITLSNRSSVNVYFNVFRISDEFSHYKLLCVIQNSETTGNISWCPANMVYGNCTCGHRLCRDPNTCQNTCIDGMTVRCICPETFYMKDDACVQERECGCYLPEEETIVPEGETHVNSDCTRVAFCSNGTLAWNDAFECSLNAMCEERDGVRNCYCNKGFVGDGETCNYTIRADCMEVYNDGFTSSGIYTIKPSGWPGSAFNVSCNMSNGGGWTVFQRRIDGSVDFDVEWQNYKEGFGNVNEEHWLGNDKIHYLTYQKRYRIHIDMVNNDLNQFHGAYDFFRIDNEAALYRLSGLGTYSGSADERSNADGYYILMDYHNRPFSTKDRDNDIGTYNIAASNRGAWWYGDYCYYYQYRCHTFNGQFSGSFYIHSLPGSNSLAYSEMKIRPV